MGLAGHLTRLLQNLNAHQEATTRTRHGTMNWFEIGKLVCQDCILSPVYLNLEVKKELNSLLMKVKEDSEKAGLKLNSQTKIMVSGPITSQQTDGETMHRVIDFIVLNSKLVQMVSNGCSYEIKRCLLLRRKVMLKLRVY